MPIDSINNSGYVPKVAKPAQTPAYDPTNVGQRQVLPGSGQSSPPAAAAGPQPGGDIKQAVQDLNTYAQSLQRDLHFSVDEESGETVVKVMDHESGEVIRQIPSKEVLAIAQSLKNVQGLLLSAKA